MRLTYRILPSYLPLLLGGPPPLYKGLSSTGDSRPPATQQPQVFSAAPEIVFFIPLEGQDTAAVPRHEARQLRDSSSERPAPPAS